MKHTLYVRWLEILNCARNHFSHNFKDHMKILFIVKVENFGVIKWSYWPHIDPCLNHVENWLSRMINIFWTQVFLMFAFRSTSNGDTPLNTCVCSRRVSKLCPLRTNVYGSITCTLIIDHLHLTSVRLRIQMDTNNIHAHKRLDYVFKIC